MTRSQSHESEKRDAERVGEMLMELSQKQEMIQRQTLELRQETRAQALEHRQEVKAQMARSEARFDELMQMITAINVQNRAHAMAHAVPENSHKVPEKSVEANGENNYNVKNGWGRARQGEGLEGWLMRAEYFFEVAEVQNDEKVRIAALHLEGKALQWHRGYSNMKGEAIYGDWKGYTAALSARFGVQVYEDPVADLRNLRQVSSLQNYMDEFDELYPSGLIEELEMSVRMFHPKTLAELCIS